MYVATWQRKHGLTSSMGLHCSRLFPGNMNKCHLKLAETSQRETCMSFGKNLVCVMEESIYLYSLVLSNWNTRWQKEWSARLSICEQFWRFDINRCGRILTVSKWKRCLFPLLLLISGWPVEPLRLHQDCNYLLGLKRLLNRWSEWPISLSRQYRYYCTAPALVFSSSLHLCIWLIFRFSLVRSSFCRELSASGYSCRMRNRLMVYYHMASLPKLYCWNKTKDEKNYCDHRPGDILADVPQSYSCRLWIIYS